MAVKPFETKNEREFSGRTPDSEPHPGAGDPLFDPIARFYDDDYREQGEDLHLVLDLAEDLAQGGAVSGGGAVLEMGCGTGRALLALAGAGHPCTGVDTSPALLAEARRKLAQAGLADRVTLIQADMRHMHLPQQDFGMAVCLSNTLMHLPTQADQIQALAQAGRHLRPGGWLLLDLFSPDVARLLQVDGLQELADRWIDPATGATVHKWVVRRTSLAHQIQETLFVYEELFPDGRVQRTPCAFDLRFLWAGEGELMLQAAGFQVEDVWGDYDFTPYDDGADRLIFWARKTS